MILARQYYRNCTRDEDGFIDEDSCYVPFWNTKTGVIVKWSLFLGIILFFGLYLLIGYIHARKRVQKGLPPLAYHRFLVNRATLAQVDPRYRYPQSNFSPYHGGYSNSGGGDGYQYYNMQGMPPPPVYDPNAPRPPVYEPPAGATKVGGDGNVAASSQSPPPPPQETGVGNGYMYAPPPGPPPPAAVAPVPSSSVDQYAPPPGPPPPSGAVQQPQGTGNSTNPFRS
ncbi:hypothetical protein B0T21DRAFT_292176 [Apiosordaria backusii]|uniref:Uncharacterized protein n=1 Tax=Apiosordaria backusii TaxID=314023 RepID=A0AA40E6Z4_9PEZI|nr:hypothetical protein B0T21DRAFT_292176 [Apiosordaria backusii]